MCLLTMDPVSHYMIAYTFGRKINADETKLKALTLAALLPDIDVISIVLGIDVLRSFHGTFTHSIIVAVFLSLVLSFIFMLYYKKNVFTYAVIGVSMHLLLDTVNTLLQSPDPQKGMILLYPFSEMKFSLTQIVPNPVVIWIIVAGTIFGFSIYMLYRFMRQNGYPWRIWIDERKIVKSLKNLRKQKN